MEIDFIEKINKLKPPVWEIIKNYLPNKFPAKHYKMVRDYPLRQGKYLRAGLILLACKMYGGEEKNARLTAAAMQLSEDWLLIHDDFEDQSEMRRHKPTLNRLFGNELAVNAGDALHIIMWKALGDNIKNLDPATGWKIYKKMYDILLTTVEGQFMELDWIKQKRITIAEKEYYQMIYRKAGYYTITGPLQLGAIIAGVDDLELKKIEKWGVRFGCAFQIWDDVMNITVNTRYQGKKIGEDIYEGKRTLMLIHLLNHCLPDEKKNIKEIYYKERPNKTSDEVQYIINLMKEYGSLDYAKRTAGIFAARAEKIFNLQTRNIKDQSAKEIIRAGIRFVANRDH